MKRISAEQDMHAKNIDHAGIALKAQLEDRRDVRSFWSGQLRWLFIFAILILIITGAICCMAIYKGDTESVFKMMTSVLTYGLSIAAGAGLDRIWINRKKTGISSNTNNS